MEESTHKRVLRHAVQNEVAKKLETIVKVGGGQVISVCMTVFVCVYVCIVV